jgi:hypothetical protein
MAESANKVAPRVDDIRSHIGETRATMSSTIDAIHDRLTPSRLLRVASRAVQEATVGRLKGATEQLKATVADSAALSTVRNNPFATFATGLAAAAAVVEILAPLRNQTQPTLPFARKPIRGVAQNRWMLGAAGAVLSFWVIKRLRASGRL